MKASEFLREVDVLVDASMNQPNSIKPCCSKGCSTCCSEPLYASDFEVKYAVDGLNDEQRLEVTERTKAWVEQAKPFFNGDTGVEGCINSYPYLEKDIKCPFLKNNLCSVYERRPMACRTYFAQGNPEHCKMPHRPKQLIAGYDFGHPSWSRLWLQVATTSDGLHLDHLGVHLARILLGENHETSMSQVYEIRK